MRRAPVSPFGLKLMTYCRLLFLDFTEVDPNTFGSSGISAVKINSCLALNSELKRMFL